MQDIAILRYRRPLEEVLAVVDEHRTYLRSLQAEGSLLASGPIDPRTGGILLLRVANEGASHSIGSEFGGVGRGR